MFKHGLFSNRSMLIALPIELTLILAAVYMPGLNAFLGGAPIPVNYLKFHTKLDSKKFSSHFCNLDKICINDPPKNMGGSIISYKNYKEMSIKIQNDSSNGYKFFSNLPLFLRAQLLIFMCLFVFFNIEKMLFFQWTCWAVVAAVGLFIISINETRKLFIRHFPKNTVVQWVTW